MDVLLIGGPGSGKRKRCVVGSHIVYAVRYAGYRGAEQIPYELRKIALGHDPEEFLFLGTAPGISLAQALEIIFKTYEESVDIKDCRR